MEPRKQNLVIYIMPGFSDYGDLLEQLVRESVKEMKRRYG